MHLVKKNGIFVAMKANVEEELNISDKVFNKYKCKIEKLNKFLLPKENSNRTLVVLRKS